MERSLFLSLIVIAVGNYQDASAEKPIMVPQKDELLIQEGSEIKIQCFSEGASIQFSFPESTFMSPRSSHKISTVADGTSTFLRQKAISLDTGWYACAAEGVEIRNDYKNLNHTHQDIAWIYIYVNSSEPFADRQYTFPKSMIVLIGSPGIVPCRPTSPFLNVQLWRDSEIVPLNETIRYDPRIGFIIEDLVFQDLVIRFHCRVHDVVDRYDLYYSKARGEKPKMKLEVPEMSIVEGDELRIECYGKSKVQFFFPSISRQTDSLAVKPSESKVFHEVNGTSIFLRRSTVFGDTGWYGCAEEGINKDIPFRYFIDYTRTEINWIYIFVQSPSAELLGENGVSTIASENDVEYEGGSDIIIPCRPTLPVSTMKIACEPEKVKQIENMSFDPKYGFIMRRERNNSVTCCGCRNAIDDELWSSNVFMCSRQLSEQEEKFLSKPGQLMLFTGEDLRLSFTHFNTYMELGGTWVIPSTVPKNRVKNITMISTLRQRRKSPLTVRYFFNALTLNNVTENDSGEYRFRVICTFKMIHDRANAAKVLVMDRRNWEFRKLNLKEDSYTFMRRQNESLRLMVDFQSFPSQMVQWVGPSDQYIERTVIYNPWRRKFHLTRGLRSLLVMNNLTLDDSGTYQIKISTSVGLMIANFTLDVQVPPTTSIINGAQPYYAAPDEFFHVGCCAVASPRPNVTWAFLKQPKYPSNVNISLVYPLEYKYVANEATTGCSYVNMSTDTTGILTCTACNFINCSTATRRIFLSGSIGRFGIIGQTERPFLGDSITLKCSGSIYAMTNLWWDTKFEECYKNVSYKTFYFDENPTRLTIQSVLHVKNVTECHNRSYSCLGRTIEGNIENSTYNLQLSVPQKPYFTSTPLDKTKIILDAELDHKKNRTLTCCADGNPYPNVTWFENDRQIEESPEHHFFPESCQLVVVLDLRDKKSRTYKCKAENRFGQIEDHVEFIITGIKEGDKKMLVAIASVLTTNFIGVVVAWFILRKRRIDRSRRKFKEAILKRFDEGAMNYVQLNVNMADQAEILPFNKKWEYPRKLLTFGKILGSGAFGIVRKAEAKSICPGKAVTTVAVKMVRATHRLHYMTALIRELKVLVHLGSHLNIVNLLGACTMNVSYGELLVIVEFCRFGNLRDYLLHRKADFIDQNDPDGEAIIDSNFETDRADVRQNCAYVTDCNDNSDVKNNCRSTDAMSKNVNANDEDLAKGLVQPGLRCQYRSDEPDLIVESICTKDLLCWAWQVARGMRYLGLRKVVHGDLAARNVLLADNNVIKICDFGLAEILYKDEDYKQLAQDLLPLQWMAIESLRDRVFSTQSDIWSFGILLWELFTLGETPYHGTNPRNLHQQLSSGYRLKQPKYAPEKIYRMMMKCWDAKPDRRPAFATIEDEIGKQLDNGIHTYYTDMSPPYTELNDETEESGKIDYLTMDPSQIGTLSLSIDPSTSHSVSINVSDAAKT